MTTTIVFDFNDDSDPHDQRALRRLDHIIRQNTLITQQNDVITQQMEKLMDQQTELNADTAEIEKDVAAEAGYLVEIKNELAAAQQANPLVDFSGLEAAIGKLDTGAADEQTVAEPAPPVVDAPTGDGTVDAPTA